MRLKQAAWYFLPLFFVGLLEVSAAAGVLGTITRLSNGSSLATQTAPAISGNNVVWTDTAQLGGGITNSDIFLLDLSTGLPALNLTSTPVEQEYLEDIDGQSLVYTHTGPTMPGDILIYDIAARSTTTVAASDSQVRYSQPAVRGRYVVYIRYIGVQPDVDGFDTAVGAPLATITNDAAAQLHPRVSGSMVVFEDYNSGNADIYGYNIGGGGLPFPIATGPNAQITPDADEGWVVWVEQAGPGDDRIVAYDTLHATQRTLTTVTSSKMQPRISRNRVVWADDRAGNLDIYSYNLDTNTEEVVVEGPGDQMLSDISNNRVVYTSNETGFEQVYLFTIAGPVQGMLPRGCDPAYTNLVGSPTTVVKTSIKTTSAKGAFDSVQGNRYYMCVENGLADGSRRTASLAAAVDGQIVLSNADFRPIADPPRWVAAELSIRDDGPIGRHGWNLAISSLTQATVTVSIRVAK